MRTNRFAPGVYRAAALVVLLACSPPALAVDRLRVCVNQETIGTPTGDMASQLMTQVGRQLPELQFELTPLPWARCLKMAERGEFDLVLAGSHSPERAKLLSYPQKADGSVDNGKRMFNLGFAMIRRVGTKIRWDGERFQHLDGPVGAQHGYSVVEYLRAQHVEVDQGSSTILSGMRKLIAGRISAMIVNPFNLDAQIHEPEFEGKLELLANPLIQKKPYFLVLSNPLNASRPEMGPKLWNAMEVARNSLEFTNLYSRYLDKAQPGLRLKP
jgi:polar amino acid transport system substrate-binding protein